MEWIFGTEVNDLATARARIKGGGASNSSALGFGGISSPPSNSVAITESQVANTETWNGSSWTEVGDLNEVQHYISGTGSSTAAITAGGNRPSGDNSVNAERNGTSWTPVADLNTARRQLSGSGSSNTSALAFGGREGPSSTDTAKTNLSQTKTETYNGTSWTEIADLNTERYLCGSGGDGVTSALAFGGGSIPGAEFNETESWDGTNWTEIAEINEGRYFEQAAGTQTAALIFGGDPGGPFTNKTESGMDHLGLQ